MEITEKEYLEALLKPLHEDVKEIKADVKKQNGRVRTLEQWRDRIIGAGVVITVGYGFALFAINKYL